MAIVARTPVGDYSSGSSRTYNYTCTAGDRMLVFVQIYSTDGAVDPTSVTYAGASLTRIGGVTSNDPNLNTSVWKLDAPDSGANNIVITMSKSVSEINSLVRCYGGSSGFGTPITNANSSQTSISGTVTGTTSGSLISDFLGIWATASGSGFSPDTGQTSVYAQNNLGGNQSQFSSDETSSGGSVAMGWSWTSPNDQEAMFIALEILEDAGNTFTLDQGSVSTVGFDANISRQLAFSLDQGSIPITGYDLLFSQDNSFLLELGTVPVTGLDIGIYRQAKFSLESETVQIIGFDANIAKQNVFVLDPGSVSVTGYDLAMQSQTHFGFEAGQVALTGFDLGISVPSASNFRLESNSLGIVGEPVDWRKIPGVSSDVSPIPQKLRVKASASIAHPVYLVEATLKEITGGEVVIRLSSAGYKRVENSPLFDPDGVVNFGAYDYESVGVAGLTPNSVTLSMDNSTRLYAFFALSDTIPLKEQRIKVWKAYSSDTIIPNDQVVLVFDGYIDGINEISEKQILFTAKAQSIVAGWTPRVRLHPPLCNHLPKAGTKVGTLTLETK